MNGSSHDNSLILLIAASAAAILACSSPRSGGAEVDAGSDIVETEEESVEVETSVPCGPCSIPLDGGCHPVGVQGCPAGWVKTDLCGCEPKLDQCKEDEIALLGGGCVKIGPTTPVGPDCKEGWKPAATGGCEPVIAPDCPEGSIAVIGGACKKVGPQDDCGEGTWGNTEAEFAGKKVWYVRTGNPGADDDGSKEKPFAKIQTAIDAAGEGDAVLVGATPESGVYPDGFTLTKGISVMGRCSGLVTVTGVVDVGKAGIKTVVLLVANSGSRLGRMTINGPGDGVYVYKGTGHKLEDLRIVGCKGNGIMFDAGKKHEVTRCLVSGSIYNGQYGWGEGVHMTGSSGISITDSSITDNVSFGITVLKNSSAFIDSVLVEGTKAWKDSPNGHGVAVAMTSYLEMASSVISGNTTNGLRIEKESQADVRGTVVSSTLASPDGAHGAGVYLDYSSKARIEGCDVTDNANGGVVVLQSTVELKSVRVADSIPMVPLGGGGVTVLLKASATVDSCTVTGNSTGGITAIDSILSVTRTLVQDTACDLSGDLGQGIQVVQGTTAEITSTVIRGSRNAGVGVSVGKLVMKDCEVSGTAPNDHDPTGRGLYAEDSQEVNIATSAFKDNEAESVAVFGSNLVLDRCLVEGTRSNPTVKAGRGLSVWEGSQARVTASRFTKNQSAGVTADGSEIEMEDCLVDGNLTPADFEKGTWGVNFQDSKASLTSCRIAGNIKTGLRAMGATSLEIEESVVSDTHQTGSGMGYGIQLVNGVKATMSRSLVSGNSESGILVGDDSELALIDSTVRDTGPSSYADGFGRGVGVQNGAKATVGRCSLSGNTQYGAIVFGSKTLVEDTFIANTAPDVQGFWGVGVGCQEKGALDVTRTLVQDNRGAGIDFLHCSGTVKDSAVRNVSTSKGKWNNGVAVEDIPEGMADGVVAVESIGVDVVNTVIDGVERAGIVFDDTPGTVNGNTVAAGKFCAVYQDVGESFKESGNTYTYLDGSACSPLQNPSETLPVSNVASVTPAVSE